MPDPTPSDGGPAFPTFYRDGVGDGQYANFPHGGMSLRAWLAGKALNGMLAHSTRYRPRNDSTQIHWHDAIAAGCAAGADLEDIRVTLAESERLAVAELRAWREPVTDLTHAQRWKRLTAAMAATDASGLLGRCEQQEGTK